MGEAKCCWLCSVIIILIIVQLMVIVPIFIVKISLARKRPAFYLDDLHVSVLNKTLTSSTNTTMIHFNLTMQNTNLLNGLYYKDPVNLTFTYFPPSINKNANKTIGRYTIQGFYQGFAKVKHVRDFVVVQDMFSLAKQLREPAKVAVLSVDLDARVKFKSIIERRKMHLVARAIVEVNCNTGNVVQNKTNFRLRHTSGSDKWRFLQRFLFAIFLVIYLTFVCILYIYCVYIWIKDVKARRGSAF